ncbi:MAG: glycosyltransferase family 39 protein [Candidatus Omnitrophota bacterium]
MKNQRQLMILGLIILAAVFFRFYGLPQQGLFFFDEGHMIYKAFLIQQTFTDHSKLLSYASNIDSKSLWILCVSFLQWVFKAKWPVHLPVQVFSAFFGILTVILTYLFAKKYFKSETIGLTSAFFLALSSYHIFYSRLVLAESICIFLSMLSLVTYLKSFEDNKGREKFLILAGLIAGSAFLFNHYRVTLLPVFILLLECENSWKGSFRSCCFNKSASRFLVFLLALLIVLLGGQILNSLFMLGGVYISSYFAALTANISSHSFSFLDLREIPLFAIYLYEYEGALSLFLLAVGLFILRKFPRLLLPVCFLFLQIFASSFVNEKGARSLAIVLPFYSMISGAVLIYLFTQWRKKALFIMIIICLGILALVDRSSKACSILTFQSDMPKAVAYLNRYYPQSSLLTTNRPLVAAYAPDRQILNLSRISYQELPVLLKENYQVIVIDPQKLIDSRMGEHWAFLDTPMVDPIEEYCQPVKTFDHFNNLLFERFLFDHALNWRATLDILKGRSQNAGKIEIYELKSCLSELKNHLSL